MSSHHQVLELKDMKRLVRGFKGIHSLHQDGQMILGASIIVIAIITITPTFTEGTVVSLLG